MRMWSEKEERKKQAVWYRAGDGTGEITRNKWKSSVSIPFSLAKVSIVISKKI